MSPVSKKLKSTAKKIHPHTSLYAILTLLVLAGIACIAWRITKTSSPKINSFEKCAAAGYPVMTTYPEQCRTPDGRLFTQATQNDTTGGTKRHGMSASFSATPTSGVAPLSVSFSASVAAAGQYIIEFDDNSNSGPLQARCLSNQSYPDHVDPTSECTVSGSHLYSSPGTYGASLSPYIKCLYSNPRCLIATQELGVVTITVK